MSCAITGMRLVAAARKPARAESADQVACRDYTWLDKKHKGSTRHEFIHLSEQQ